VIIARAHAHNRHDPHQVGVDLVTVEQGGGDGGAFLRLEARERVFVWRELSRRVGYIYSAVGIFQQFHRN
jgi:hypothetical protein